MSSCKGCNGRCCDPVVLGLSPQELTEAYINTKTGLKKVANPSEVEKMWRLFTFKGVSRISPMEKGEYKDGGVMHMYQCSNYNTTTKKCMDYDNRPQMCKDYGEKNKCAYTNCK